MRESPAHWLLVLSSALPDRVCVGAWAFSSDAPIAVDIAVKASTARASIFMSASSLADKVLLGTVQVSVCRELTRHQADAASGFT
jgi:hypothetical protein